PESMIVVSCDHGRKFRLSGLTSPAGGEWVKVRHRSRDAYVPMSKFSGTSTDAIKHLATAGIYVIGPREAAAIRDAVQELKSFPPRPLIERPGRTGPHFAMPDGRVFSPPGSEEAIVLFTPDPAKCSAKGIGREWRDQLCKPLIGQHLCVFAFCFAFA